MRELEARTGDLPGLNFLFSVSPSSHVWSNTRKAMSAVRTPGLYPRLCAERLFPSAVWVDY